MTVKAMRSRGVRMMAGQRFLQLFGTRGHDEMLEICGDMLGGSGRWPNLAGTGSLVVVADEHAMPYYGRGKSPGGNGGEGKDGGNWFEPYMTIQVVSGKSPVTLSAYRIAAGESQTHYLGAVMENGQTSRLEHWRAASGQGPQFGGKHSGDGWSGRAVRHVKVGGPQGASHDGGAEADPDKAVRPYAITAKDGRTATANMATVLKNIKPCHVKCGDAKGAGPSRRRTCALCFSPTCGWTAPRSCSNTSRRRTAPGGHRDGAPLVEYVQA